MEGDGIVHGPEESTLTSGGVDRIREVSVSKRRDSALEGSPDLLKVRVRPRFPCSR